MSDQIFVNPVWELAKAVRGEGREVWMYRLRTGVKNILDNSPFGIMYVLSSSTLLLSLSELKRFSMTISRHSMDLPLIFNCSSLWPEDLSSNDAKTSKALGSRWLNYGATGQPGNAPPSFLSIFLSSTKLMAQVGSVHRSRVDSL